MSAEWTLSPYAVALLLDAPEPVADAMMRVYTAAENARRACGQHPTMPTGKAIHATYVQHVAYELATHDEPDDELAEWLMRAASVLVLDAGLDLETMAAPTEPPRRGSQRP